MSELGLRTPSGGVSAVPRRAYIYRHIVSFEETNVVGNVYYTRHVAWQGRCRELFLRDHVPQIVDDLSADLRLVTLRVSCEYYQELRAFEEIEIEMLIEHQRAHRIGLTFQYLLLRDGQRLLVAKGFQEIACMRQYDGGMAPSALPPNLVAVLKDWHGRP